MFCDVICEPSQKTRWDLRRERDGVRWLARPGLLDLYRAQRHAFRHPAVRALAPTGRRKQRETRRSEEREKTCLLPSLSA